MAKTTDPSEPAQASLTLPQPPPALRPQATVARGLQPSRSGTVLALQARALAHEHFRTAAGAVMTELAARMGCERVSIGLYRQGRLVIGAISNTTDVRAQQNTVRAICKAMEESLDQAAVVLYPLPVGATPTLTLAHAELAKLNGQTAICTVPIVGRGQKYGALLFERRDGFDARCIEMAKDAATFVGPVLELKHRVDQPLGDRIVDAVSPGRGRSRWRFGAWQVGAIVAVAALIGVAVWPSPFRVVAPARVEGEGQRIVAAPVDGFIQSAPLRPGASVSAGQVLVTLDDHDLVLEREKANAEIAQLDKVYREALSKDDAAQIVIARSKVEQVQAQLGLVQSQLERLRLTAPFAGVVLSGDLTQSVGQPVKRGQELMTIAPDRSFRVVAEVDEQDIGELRVGQRAQVLFAASAQDSVDFTVTRIAPVATTIDGRNVFEVDGRIVGSTDALRPGLRGVARIDVESSTLGWIWWHRASQWAQRTWWRVLG